MKRALHQAIVFFALLLLVTLARMPFGSYRETILPKVRNFLSPQGISVDFADLSLEPPITMLLDKLNVVFPVNRFPVPVAVDKASLSFRPLSLLTLKATGDGEAKLYQGTVNYSFSRPVFGTDFYTDASLTNLSLAAHPLLGSFGLSGTLEGKFTGYLKPDVDGRLFADSGTLSLALRNAAFQGGIKVFQLVQIPQIENIALVLQGQIEPSSLSIGSLSFESSMGNFAGKGKLKRLNPSQLGEGKINGTLKLSETGKRLFGGYLALAAQSPIDNPASDWNIEVTFDKNGFPQSKIAPAS